MSSIFLDIDGVLNSTRSMVAARVTNSAYRSYMERHYSELDPIAISLLRGLVQKSKAEIIISSSWRILYKDIQFFKDLFTNFGWKDAPVVGMTPITDSGFRGQEVHQYIECNDFFNTPYVIIDDDSDFYEHQPLVRTDSNVGLSYDNYSKALSMLGCVEK